MLFAILRAKKCKIAYIYNEKSIYWPPESPDAPAPKLPLYTGDNSLNWTKEKNINETQQYDEVANLDFEASAAGDIESNSESSKVQNSIYLLCFLQFGELKSAK